MYKWVDRGSFCQIVCAFVIFALPTFCFVWFPPIDNLCNKIYDSHLHTNAEHATKLTKMDFVKMMRFHEPHPYATNKFNPPEYQIICAIVIFCSLCLSFVQNCTVATSFVRIFLNACFVSVISFNFVSQKKESKIFSKTQIQGANYYGNTEYNIKDTKRYSNSKQGFPDWYATKPSWKRMK